MSGNKDDPIDGAMSPFLFIPSLYATGFFIYLLYCTVC